MHGRFLAFGLSVAFVAGAPLAVAQSRPPEVYAGDNDALQWNAIAVQAIRESKMGPPVAARALAVLHTCIYDAWAAYDATAMGAFGGERARRPAGERTADAQRAALNEAAYWAFLDVFPTHARLARDQMTRAGLVPTRSLTRADPQTVGRTLCAGILAARHRDGANQLGDVNDGGRYSDYTGYRPRNTATRLVDIEHWRPELSTTLIEPTCLVPHWGRVQTFAFKVGAGTRPPPPAKPGTPQFRAQAEDLVRLSAALTERDKAIVEYWMDGPQSETPPGHWNLIAHEVSRRDGHRLADDVQLLFVLNSALMDASIAAWDAKLHYDYVRPITAIRHLFAGERIRAWAGPGQETREIDGASWLPYQRANQVTPPFPEYVSGHSTFSAAAAEILARFTGGDRMGLSHTVAARSSIIERHASPTQAVVLSWDTFSEAAREAGYSRRLGGIHFEQADVEGQRLGRRVADAVWARAVRLMGRASSPVSP